MMFETSSVRGTEQKGRNFSRKIITDELKKHRPIYISLRGDLGAGKTAMVRGMLKGLGYAGNVTSPTFSLCNNYSFNGYNCFHLDLYRIADEDELFASGLTEFDDSDVIFIEWPEVASRSYPFDFDIYIRYGEGAEKRIIEIRKLKDE